MAHQTWYDGVVPKKIYFEEDDEISGFELLVNQCFIIFFEDSMSSTLLH